MKKVTFRNPAEVLQRTVATDGRVGGLQKFVGKTVSVVVTLDKEEDN